MVSLATSCPLARDRQLPVGAEGRNRCMLGLASWLRSFIQPRPGHTIAYCAYNQQEFGIAASLSNDANTMRAFRTGDPYMAFAVQAGAAPEGAAKKTHGPARDQFKTAILGVQSSIGAEALADRLNVPYSRRCDLLRLHGETYPDYWPWSEGCVGHAMPHGHLTASFGWRIHVSAQTCPTTLYNFLLQSNGSEMLRLACILADECGLHVGAPVHDAVLVEAPGHEIDVVVAEVQRPLREASLMVLPGFPSRSDAEVVRYPDRVRRSARQADVGDGLGDRSRGRAIGGLDRRSNV